MHSILLIECTYVGRFGNKWSLSINIFLQLSEVLCTSFCSFTVQYRAFLILVDNIWIFFNRRRKDARYLPTHSRPHRNNMRHWRSLRRMLTSVQLANETTSKEQILHYFTLNNWCPSPCVKPALGQTFVLR